MAEYPRIHLSPPAVSEREIDAVVAAIRSGWVAPVGPDLDAFERDLAIGGRNALRSGLGEWNGGPAPGPAQPRRRGRR